MLTRDLFAVANLFINAVLNILSQYRI